MVISYTQLLHLALPEVIVVLTSILVIAIDLLALRRSSIETRFTTASLLGTAGCVAAIIDLILAPQHVTVLNGVFLANPLTQFVQISLLILSIFTLLLTADSDFTTHAGEFVLLILLATVGMMFLVATADLLVIFISLELLSLSLYILTAFDKRSARSSEAALKYFLFGGMSAAFLLFGFSLFYGLANSTNLWDIPHAIHSPSPLLVVAMITTMVGFGFKIAAVPFHFWAPDVYEAAPTPAAAFIASSSKVASFFIFFEVVAVVSFAGAPSSTAWLHFTHGFASVFALVAALSMVLGNLVAIRQTSLRRLIAYSAIAHAGYMLLPFVASAGYIRVVPLASTTQSAAALLYYVVTYALGTIGIFAIVGVVEKHTGSDHLSSFDGLSRRAPVLAGGLFIFLLSLAGIPPLSGFFAKFYIFLATLSATPNVKDLLWLVILAIAMSAVSLYYYLKVLKRVYVTAPTPDAPPIRAPFLTQLVIIVLAAATVLLGCFPHLLLRWIEQAIA
jgi:NADH-quinone oxidoreductase subunit N